MSKSAAQIINLLRHTRSHVAANPLRLDFRTKQPLADRLEADHELSMQALEPSPVRRHCIGEAVLGDQEVGELQDPVP